MLACPIDRIFLGSQSVCPREGARGVDVGVEPIPAELSARFKLIEPFAKGDAGTLYLVDETNTGRRGLLKILFGLRAHDSERQRVLRELEKQTSLSVAQLAAPIACGQVGSTLWFFREWIDGISLRVRLVRHGALPVAEALAIVAQMANSLEELHRAGLLHRDVKPGHVMLHPQPSGLPRTVLIDAGVANTIASQELVEVHGTAAYVSPEQAAGRIPSFRSDLYSVGCVLFEMLCGRTPYQGTDAALLDAHVHAPVPPLSAQVPSSVASLVSTLLAKDPKERPFSALQITRALEPFLPESISKGREPTMSFETSTAGALWMSMQSEKATGTGTLRPPGLASSPPQDDPESVDTDEVETVPVDPRPAPPAARVSKAPPPLPSRVPPPLPSRAPPPLPSQAPPSVIARPIQHVSAPPVAAPPVAAPPVAAPRVSEPPAIPPAVASAELPAASARAPKEEFAVPLGPKVVSKPASRWPWFLAGACVLLAGAAAMAAVGWFVLRGKGASPTSVATENPQPETTLPSPPSSEIGIANSQDSGVFLDAFSADAPEHAQDATVDADAGLEVDAPDAVDEAPAPVAIPTPIALPDAGRQTAPDARPNNPPRESPRTPPPTKTARTRPTRTRTPPAPAGDPQRADDLATQARDAVQRRDFAAAADLYARATQENPRSARLFAALGAARLGARDVPNAIAAYERAAALEPQNAERHIALARTLALAGNRAQAAEEFRRALAIQPENRAATQGLESLGAQ